MTRIGWTVHELNRWTRKTKNEKDKGTNIDIVATSRIPQEDVTIQGLQYDNNILDHIPIQISVRNINNNEENLVHRN